MIVVTGRQEPSPPLLVCGVGPEPTPPALVCGVGPEATSSSVPGGQRGGRMQRLPACPPRWVPRGQAASGGTQMACPFSISTAPFAPQRKGVEGTAPASERPRPAATPARPMHEAEAASSTSRSPHGRNRHPSRLMRADGPQKESPTAGGTHAPSTGTVSPVHSQRPDEGLRMASRGQSGRPRSVIWAAAAAALRRGGPAEHPMAPTRAKARTVCHPFAERRTG